MIDTSLQTTWRGAHLGHWLALALQRFDARVLALMAVNETVPLALSNLASRGSLTTGGLGLTALAQRAGVSKQAMGKLVDQCEAWDLVERQRDPNDARARRVVFTQTGMAWLKAYEEAVTQAQAELRSAVGDEIATVIAIGLEAYAA